MTRATGILCLMHLLGNALLLWFAYYWLGIGESTIARLTGSALLAVLIMAAALWLHGSGFAFFRTDRSALMPAVQTALRNLLPLFVLAIVVLTVYGLLAWWRVHGIFDRVLWIVRWIILPVLLLPLAGSIVNRGWRGFHGEAWKPVRRWLYWVQIAALPLVGIWLPIYLITWVPGFRTFGTQMTSFLIRLLVAYLLFVASWLRAAQVS